MYKVGRVTAGSPSTTQQRLKHLKTPRWNIGISRLARFMRRAFATTKADTSTRAQTQSAMSPKIIFTRDTEIFSFMCD
jgi:hypothetical protein